MSGSSENKKLPDAPLLVTGGDPAGIGPELLEKTAPLLARSGIPARIFATGPESHCNRLRQIFRSERPRVSGRTESDLRNDKDNVLVEIISVRESAEYLRWADKTSAAEQGPGKPGAWSGMLAYLALKEACDHALANGTSGLLTAPLAKSWVGEAIGEGFPGHTDYFAVRFRRRVLMIMHAPELSVIPLTIHVPLSDVPRALREVMSDPEITELLISLNRSNLLPGRWALCGLNPHAGESGHLGREEKEFMSAAAENWRAQGLRLAGPLPGDAVFEPENRRKYRLILSAYHDQGLGPFKALVGRRGINVTWGLPFFRASPDHGTAFDIAGRGDADPTSMEEALRFLLSVHTAAAISGGLHGS